MPDLTEDEAIDYVLGQLAPSRSSAIDELMSESPEPAEMAGGFRDALTAYALATSEVVEPAPSLRERVLQAATGGEVPPSKVIPFPFLPWLVAACAVAVAGMVFLLSQGKRQQLANENDVLRQENVRLIGEVEKSDLRVRELASQVDQSFKAFIVWDEARGAGVLKVDNLPSLGESGDYQLWVVADGYEQPLDGGVFDTDEGRAEMQIVTKQLAESPAKADKVTLFAISRERAGGVPVSETKDFVLTAAY